MSSFSLVAFKIFALSLAFDWCWYPNLFDFILFWVCWAFWIWRLRSWEVLNHYFFKYSSCSFLLFVSGTSIEHVLVFLMVFPGLSGSGHFFLHSFFFLPRYFHLEDSLPEKLEETLLHSNSVFIIFPLLLVLPFC